MDETSIERKPAPVKERGTKRIAEGEEPIVRIPVILEPVEVEVPLVAIVPQFRNVPVAVRVLPHRPTVQDIVFATALRMLSGLYRIRDLKIP